MNETSILFKRLEPVQIAAVNTRIETREQIPPLLDRLHQVCSAAICGQEMVIFHGGAVKDGFLIEAAIPVSHPVETDEIHTRILEPVPVLAMMHYGEHKTIRETVLKIYAYLEEHAGTTSLFRREIYHVLDCTNPEKNVTEVQVVLHEWHRLLEEGVAQVLGWQASQNVMQGIESITIDSTFDEYNAWIRGAIDRLDALTDSDEKKCQAVSHCAHVFPQERIDFLRSIYQTGDFDAVLHQMYRDEFWYEKPVRRGNVLYMRKNPFDPDGYAKAATDAERRMAYCHCPFVRPYLDQPSPNPRGAGTLSPSFCFCGAGWYRRLWEGILGQPVKIAHVETLLKGNNQCTLAITLPLELAGECIPEH